MLYENLDVWKRSRLMSIDLYRVLNDCRDYGFKDQITRSMLSVPSNIAEGCERSAIKERKRFLDFAKGSLGEFKTQANIGIEIEYIPKNIGEKWLSESRELTRMLGALIKKIDEKIKS